MPSLISRSLPLLAVALPLVVVAPARAQDVEAKQPRAPDVSEATSLQRVLDDGAKQQKHARFVGGLAAVGIGAAFVGIGTGLVIDGFSKSSSITPESGGGLTMLVGGGITLLAAPFFLIPGDVEDLALKTKPLAAAGDLPEMERRLDRLSHKNRVWRSVWAVSAFTAAAIITPIGVGFVVTDTSLNESSHFDLGAAVGIVDTMLIAFGVAELVRPSLAEELNRAWTSGSRFYVAPSATNRGVSITAVATF